MRTWIAAWVVFAVAAGAAPVLAQDRPADSPEALKKVVEDILGSLKAGKPDTAAELIKSLKLPDHEKWFARTFGAEAGAPLAARYAQQIEQFDAGMLKMFDEQLKKNRTSVTAYKLTDPSDKNATGLQQKALAAMKEKTPLYGVNLVEPGKESGMHLWNFVYVDGAFRMVGKLAAR